MKSTSLKSILALLFFCVSLSAVNVYSQPAQDFGNTKDQELKGSGRVNPSTLAMEFSLPMGNYPGRGINMPISISYSSKVWGSVFEWRLPKVTGIGCNALNKPEFANTSASGWTSSAATPYIEYYGWDNLYNQIGFPVGNDCVSDSNPYNNDPGQVIKRLILHLPSGETHELRLDDTPDVNNVTKDGVFYAVDSSNIRYIEDSATGTYKVEMPDGSYYSLNSSWESYDLKTIRKCIKYTDRNGNYIEYDDTNKQWTDTAGRTIKTPFDLVAPSTPTVATYKLPGLGGGANFVEYKFYWKRLIGSSAEHSAATVYNSTLNYISDLSDMGVPHHADHLFDSKSSALLVDYDVKFNPVLLTKIKLPNGLSYEFSYDKFGQIDQIKYPTGAKETFTYSEIVPLTQSDSDNVNDQMNMGVTNRKLYPDAAQNSNYEWNYEASYQSPNGYRVSTTNPDGTVVDRYLHQGYGGLTRFGFDNVLAGMPYEECGYDNAGNLLSRKLISWSKDVSERAPRVDYEQNFTYDISGNGVMSVTKHEYRSRPSDISDPVL